MEIKDVRSFVDMIRDASKADLIIVSLFLLPLLLGAWSILLNNLRLLDNHDAYKLAAIGFVLVTYVLGLIVMRSWDPREEKLKRARYHVANRLRQRKRASFEAISNEVNEAYTKDFLKELIDKYPGVFRVCTMKSGNKPGITLVEEYEAPEAAEQAIATARANR